MRQSPDGNPVNTAKGIFPNIIQSNVAGNLQGCLHTDFIPQGYSFLDVLDTEMIQEDIITWRLQRYAEFLKVFNLDTNAYAL